MSSSCVRLLRGPLDWLLAFVALPLYVTKRDAQVRPVLLQRLGKVAHACASMDKSANADRAVVTLRGNAASPDLVEAIRNKDDHGINQPLVALQKIRAPSACPQPAFLL